MISLPLCVCVCVQSLFIEAEEIVEGVGVALQEGEIAVATGDQLLSMAREIYEVVSRGQDIEWCDGSLLSL